jgi:hypothetical protein
MAKKVELAEASPTRRASEDVFASAMFAVTATNAQLH